MSGLSTLDLSGNGLTTLPADIFDGLGSLSVLSLKKNRLTALPAGVFDGLSALTRLVLEANRLETLRADAFSGLTALRELILRKNRLNALPSGVFSGLGALRHINLRNNRLRTLPGDVFSGLTSLEILNLMTNRLSSLPDGLLAGLTGLTSLRLLDNGNTAPSLTVSLEKVGEDRLRAVAPVGAPFEMELPVSLGSGGELAGGATGLTIPVGAVASAAVSVTRTAGTYDAVTADIGTVPALPADHEGYALVKSADLPVEVLEEVTLPTVAISAVSAEVTEGAGAAFTVTRTGSTAAPVDVSVQVTATGTVLQTPSDYASAVTVTIPAQSATATLTVATDDDAEDEELPGSPGVAGRIAAAVQSGTGYTPAGSGNATATVAVEDNDPLETGLVPSAAALVSNLAQPAIGSLFVHSTMTLYQGFTVGPDSAGYDGYALTSVAASVLEVPDTPSGVTVSLYSADASGNPDSRLYTLSNPAAFAEGTNAFTAPADAALEAGTTYFVAFGYTGTDRRDFQLDYSTSTGEDAGAESGWSIADREHGVPGSVLMIGVNGRKTLAPPASLSVTGGRAQEGTDTTIGFDVTLDRTAAGAVTVSYRTVDGTAVAGEDYTAASGMLTFAPGQTSKSVSVAVLDDLVDEDEETFTLILHNASGAGVSNAQAQGTIANSDPLPRAWLVRFGRTVASHVAEGIGDRLTQSPSGASQASFAGARLPFGQDASLARSGAAFLRHPGEARGPWDRHSDLGLARYGTSSPAGWRNVPGTSTRGLTDLDLLLGSSFLIPLGSDDEEEAAARWTLWGRGMASRFDGTEDALRLRGDVRTYMLGADTERGRWLTGVALAHSTGAGGYDAVLDAGRSERGILDSALTSVHPYARFALNDRLSTWGVLGYGQGELTLDREGSGVWDTATSMQMAAAGAPRGAASGVCRWRAGAGASNRCAVDRHRFGCGADLRRPIGGLRRGRQPTATDPRRLAQADVRRQPHAHPERGAGAQARRRRCRNGRRRGTGRRAQVRRSGPGPERGDQGARPDRTPGRGLPRMGRKRSDQARSGHFRAGPDVRADALLGYRLGRRRTAVVAARRAESGRLRQFCSRGARGCGTGLRAHRPPGSRPADAVCGALPGRCRRAHPAAGLATGAQPREQLGLAGHSAAIRNRRCSRSRRTVACGPAVVRGAGDGGRVRHGRFPGHR